MDKFLLKTKSMTSKRNKAFKSELYSYTHIHSSTDILKHLKRNKGHSTKSIQNIHHNRNSLKLTHFEEIIPITIEDSLELNQEKFLKRIESRMKNKINDMKLLHVVPIKKQKKTIAQESIKQSNISKNSKNNPLTKLNKENHEIAKEEKKLILQRKFLRKYRKLRKKKIIYDSLEGDESMEEKENGYLIFKEGSNILFRFDFIMLVTSVFLFFHLSIYFANSKIIRIGENKIILYFYYAIDILFICDIVVMFFRGFYDINHKFIKSRKEIIIHYLKKDLVFDILTGLPIFFIERYYYNKYYKNNNIIFFDDYYINYIFSFLQFFHILKVFKIFKVINKTKNYATNRFFEFITKFILGEKIYLGLSYFIYYFIFLHLLVCSHIFIGKQTYPNWITSLNMQNFTFISLYITSIYFLMETMTTVGYGDMINVSTLYSLIFQIILLSIGIVAYSWIITILGNYVKNESRAEIKYNQNLTLLEEIRLENPHLPFRLYNKIHQHLESLSQQQNKCDLNIFINSLPYSLKNDILFTIYEKPVKNFKFFKLKNEKNSDFVLRVLTSFIPLFSKKKAVIIREGEIPENIVFVKNGKLSLEAAIDLRILEKSVHKYLHLNFDESKILEKKSIFSASDSSREENVINKIETLHNHNLLAKSYMHESFTDDEIAKYDLGENDLDNVENVNFKYLHIMDIYSNEYIGDYYLFKKKQFPLTLRVKSKTANIFLLRKNDAFKISVTFPKIWGKLTKKSERNYFALKEVIYKKINNYCISQNIDVDPSKKKDKKKKKIKIDILNMVSIKEILQTEKVKNEEIRSSKFLKNSKINTQIISKSSNNIKKSMFPEKNENKKNESSRNIPKRSSTPLLHIYPNSSGNLKLNRSNIKIDNRLGDTKQNSKFKSTSNCSFKYPQPTTKNLSSSNALKQSTLFKFKFGKTKKSNKNYKNKKYYKILCINLMKKLNNIQNNGSKNSINDYNLKEKNSITAYNNSNNFLYNINGICSDSESEKEIDLTSSSSSSFSPCFNMYKLSISFQGSFTFESSYKNLNILSKGKYIRSKNLREETQNFLKKLQESHISSSKFSNITPIKMTKSQDSIYSHKFKFKNNCHSFSESKNEEGKSKNSKIKKLTKKTLNRNSSVNLKNHSKINIEKINEEKSYKGIDSRISEKSDAVFLRQINESNKNKGGTSDFSSILKNIMSRSKNCNQENQNDKSHSNDFFMEYRLNENNNEFIKNGEYNKNESIKKMTLNNTVRNTNNNVIQIRQYNTMKTENNKICIIF